MSEKAASPSSGLAFFGVLAVGTARNDGRDTGRSRYIRTTSSDSRAPAPAARATPRPEERMARPIEPPVIRITAATRHSTTRMVTPTGPISPWRIERA